MIIIGAGVAGLLAANYFKHMSPVVYDAIGPTKDYHKQRHQAIFRIKDEMIGMLLGVPLEKVTIQKAILYHERLHSMPTFTTSNLYSLKVNGCITGRSIDRIVPEDEVRYIFKGDVPVADKFIKFSHKLVSVDRNVATFECPTGERTDVSFDYCISTIPMPQMLSSVGSYYDVHFEANPVFVMRYNIKRAKGDVHQTIYVPELEFATYRMSLEGNVLIVEAVGCYPMEAEVEDLAWYFGLTSKDLDPISQNVQSYGKLVDIDDGVRRAVIMELTERHNVFSLGRLAVWRSIRIDDLLKDLENISRMIASQKVVRTYEHKLNKI